LQVLKTVGLANQTSELVAGCSSRNCNSTHSSTSRRPSALNSSHSVLVKQ
jgi:hypothetical protein